MLIFAVFFSTCRTNPEEKKEILTATLKGPSAISMIYLIDSIPFTLSGYSIRIEVFNEPNQVKAMIMEGAPEFAVVPTTMAALLYNKGQGYILAAIPVWGTLYLFGNDTTIRHWSDLKGKRISLMSKGNTPDVLFRYLARANGLQPDKDYYPDYSFPGHIELANAIASGAASLGVISEPMVSLVQKTNPGIRPLLDLNKEWDKQFGGSIPLAQTALLVRRDFAENHPERVKEYLGTLSHSMEKINSNLGETARLTAKHGILPDSSTASLSIPRCHIKYISASDAKTGVHEYLKVFYNFNPLITGGTLPDENFYYQEPNP